MCKGCSIYEHHLKLLEIVRLACVDCECWLYVLHVLQRASLLQVSHGGLAR